MVSNLNIVVNRIVDEYIQQDGRNYSKEFESLTCSFVVRMTLDYINRALALDKTKESDAQIKSLYQKLLHHPEIIKQMRKESFFFRFWEMTGIYKSVRPIKLMRRLLKK